MTQVVSESQGHNLILTVLYVPCSQKPRFWRDHPPAFYQAIISDFLVTSDHLKYFRLLFHSVGRVPEIEQVAAVQKTHGGQLVSVRVCLGTTFFRGSTPPTVLRQHLLIHTPSASMGRSWTHVEDLTKRRMLLTVNPPACVRAHPR